MREMFRSSLESMLVETVSSELISEAEAGVWPVALWDAAESGGFTRALAMDDGPGWSDVFVIVETAGRSLAPIPLVETIIANWVLHACGLEPLDGPATISDSAELTYHDGKVSGRASGVPWGQSANHLIAIAGGATPKVFVLNTADAEMVCGVNIAREPRDLLTFHEARPVLESALPNSLPADVLHLAGALMRSGQIAGALRTVLDDTVAYALERKQFGRSISEFQAVQQQISVLAEHAAAASISAEAACAATETGVSEFMIGSAKVTTSEGAGAGAAIAHAVHGAMGFALEHRLHFATRRLWSWRTEFGGIAEWSVRLGEQVLRDPEFSLWEKVVNETTPRPADTCDRAN